MVRLWAIASLAAVLVVGIGVAAYVMRAPDNPGRTVTKIVSEPDKTAGDPQGGTEASSGDQTVEGPEPASEAVASAPSRAEAPTPVPATPAPETPEATPPDLDTQPGETVVEDREQTAETAPTELQPIVAAPADSPAGDSAAEQQVAALPDRDENAETAVTTDSPADDPAAEPQIAALPDPEKAAETTVVPDDTDGAAEPLGTTEEPSPRGPPPSFDIVRIERSGEAVIAGRAMPGSDVQIILNGKVLGSTTSDARGQWVFLPQVPLDPGNHQLSLRSKPSGEDGQAVESDNIVVVVVPRLEVVGQASKPEKAPETQTAVDAEAAPESPAKTAMVAPSGRTGADAEDGSDGEAESNEEAAATTPAPIAEPARKADRETSAGAQEEPVQTSEKTAEKAEPVADEEPDEITEIATILTVNSPVSEGNATAEDTASAPDSRDAGTSSPAETTPMETTESVEPESGAVEREAQVAANEQGVSPGQEEVEPEFAEPAASDQVAATETEQPEPPREPLAILLPRSGRGGAKILQDPGQTGVSDLQLVLRSVDYDAKGNVTISGEAAPGARVIVYLDNEAIGQGVVGAAGRWRFTPKRSVPSGLHRLRVDQTDDQGTVVARVETPFSRAAILTDLPQEKFVVVQPGNSLWRIARAVYGEGLRYSEIHQSNHRQIQDPDLIYPGQIFMVPQVN